MATPAATEGLRERKKRRTRELIAREAMKLFKRHGFDNVTVADVARAADVSEKTVFNYFPAKEDLAFTAGAERRAELVEAIRSLEPGASLTTPFRRMTSAMLDEIEHGSVERITEMPRLVAGSKALRDRLFIGWEEEAAMLAPVVAVHLGEPPDSVLAALTARSLAWAHRLTFRAAFTRLFAGEDRAAVATDLRAQAERAYDRLEMML